MNHFDIAFAVEITTEKLAQALREDLEKDLRDISVEEAIATVKATPDASVTFMPSDMTPYMKRLFAAHIQDCIERDSKTHGIVFIYAKVPKTKEGELK
jgi:hypothetical protein